MSSRPQPKIGLGTTGPQIHAAVHVAGQADRRVFQDLLAGVHVSPQPGRRGPQERERSGHVRRGGRGAREQRNVGPVEPCRAQVDAGRRQVRLEPIGTVDGHGTERREGRDGVVQPRRPDREASRRDRGRVGQRRAARPEVARGERHRDSRRAHRVHRGVQHVRVRAALRRRTAPGVVDDVRGEVRARVLGRGNPWAPGTIRSTRCSARAFRLPPPCSGIR